MDEPDTTWCVPPNGQRLTDVQAPVNVRKTAVPAYQVMIRFIAEHGIPALRALDWSIIINRYPAEARLEREGIDVPSDPNELRDAYIDLLLQDMARDLWEGKYKAESLPNRPRDLLRHWWLCDGYALDSANRHGVRTAARGYLTAHQCGYIPDRTLDRWLAELRNNSMVSVAYLSK